MPRRRSRFAPRGNFRRVGRRTFAGWLRTERNTGRTPPGLQAYYNRNRQRRRNVRQFWGRTLRHVRGRVRYRNLRNTIRRRAVTRRGMRAVLTRRVPRDIADMILRY